MISFTVDPVIDVPLPLSRISAIHKATELKCKGWTWTAVAQAMGEYHGHWLSADTWRMSAVSIGLTFPKREMTPAKLAVLTRLQQRNRGEVAA